MKFLISGVGWCTWAGNAATQAAGTPVAASGRSRAPEGAAPPKRAKK